MSDDDRMDGMEGIIEDKVQSALKENNEQLLKNIEGMINKISVPIPSCSDIQEKPKLKRKSNDEQYRHNAKVMAKLEDVSTSLSSQDIDRARVSVIEGNIFSFRS